MNRRVLTLFGALLLLIGAAAPALALQEGSPEATPESAFAGLGLPELTITVTANGYEGIPAQVEAGRYLVTVVVNEDAGEFGGNVAFVRPEGVSAEEFLSALFGPPPGSEATPVVEAEASPSDGGETGGMPPFVMQSTFAGGAFALAGETVQVVVDLTIPGEWFVWAEDPEAPQQPVTFEVTGESPAELPEPTADVVVTMGEYLIEVTEGQLVADRNIVRIDNIGAQPHFVVVEKGPDDLTMEQIAVVLDEEMQAEMSGTPAAYSDLNPEEDFGEGPYNPTQSLSTSVWVEWDLEPGRYLLVCFFPDIADGIPHAYKGMYNVVEVAG